MLNSGIFFSRFAQQKKINIPTLVLSEKKILNETKNHYPPPFKLNGRSLMHMTERIFNALHSTQTFDPSFVHWRLI